jgi:hypothetical protein
MTPALYTEDTLVQPFLVAGFSEREVLLQPFFDQIIP